MQSFSTKTILRLVVSIATFAAVLWLGVHFVTSTTIVPAEITLDGGYDLGRSFIALLFVGGIIGGMAMSAAGIVDNLLFGVSLNLKR
jgi:hypothetical protein